MALLAGPSFTWQQLVATHGLDQGLVLVLETLRSLCRASPVLCCLLHLASCPWSCTL
jgi:hypothetical protein